MKRLVLFVLASVSIGLIQGCKSFPSAQEALNVTLPPTFTGDAHVSHKNTWFDFTIDCYGLRKTPEGLWTWDSIDYVRNGRFSTGGIKLTPKTLP